MRADQERKLDRLMAGSPDLSVQEKEAMLGALLTDSNQPAGSASRWVWARWSMATAAAVAVVLLVVLLPSEAPRVDGFTTRGGSQGPAFTLTCKAPPQGGGPGLRCARDSLLAFRLAPQPDATHFSAAGLGPDAKLRYYFPSRTTGSLPLQGEPLGARGVVLGADHPAGAYRVFGCYTEGPIEPDRIRAAIEARLAGRPFDLPLVERRFEVVAP